MTELLVLNVAQKVTPAVSLDGSRVRTLVDGLDEFPDGVVVDSQRGHIYGTNMGIRDPGFSARSATPQAFLNCSPRPRSP
jgi:hypothetical protein